MAEGTSRKLEFDRVVAHTAGYALSVYGRDTLSSSLPFSGHRELQEELERVLELKGFLEEGSTLPFDTLADMRPLLATLEMHGGVLEPGELQDLHLFLDAAAGLRRRMVREAELRPRLAVFGAGIPEDAFVRPVIREVIDEQGVVKSSASGELARIRRALVDRRRALGRTLERILGGCRSSGWLMEDTLTIRNGRQCLAMRLEYRHRVPGFVQDYSGSGQTVFLEPAECMEITNAILEGEIEERREIERILRETTARIRPELPDLLSGASLMAAFDSLYARARFALETRSVLPALSEGTEFRIKRGYHPWLLISHRDREVLPLDLELGLNEQVLIISGPNAGGKSVAMKTAGLLSFMLLHGYLLPCSESSVFPLFTSIGIEIGDEQSIENDLSTFSSHLREVRRILDAAGRGSLVLIDELCSGTDVEEGSAIARTIIEELLRRGTKAIVTTHLGDLKAYAHSREGVVNGAMEFDRRALQPTFRFIKGVPGSSFAFAMMQRMGFPPAMVREAESAIGEGHRGLEELLEDLQELLASNRLLHLELEAQSASILLREQAVTEAESMLRRRDREQRQKASKELQRELHRARLEIRDILAEANAAAGDPRAVQEARRKLASRAGDAEKKEALLLDAPAPTLDRSIRPGDLVQLLDTSASGEIESLRGDMAVVLCGTFRLTTSLSNLEKTSKRQVRKAAGAPAPRFVGWNATTSPVESTTLDLRGLTGDEAAVKIERFLDALRLNRIERATIIHGMGTGALRRRTEEVLRNHPHVHSWRLGGQGEGSSGVTIVTLA
ncbi:endonuclease MutS2 [Pelodictyon luteolum]|uniref:Endonuclease MutS2 n=1 Tax=Chlorobium luteolum (strain DSM 273 / BCRC 81028 / 2530) TaxID=319225 RepID=Q3B5P6_CHLL3|nr:Smr/MutS family protein [Pelodictyon luteolum]ABB23335.1 DNA mismatch repair protein MutS-like protein [Pelodictyon luteolum DSM 273]